MTNLSLRSSLKKRVRNFFKNFNLHNWERCYQYLDPMLRAHARITPEQYASSLKLFEKHYGTIEIHYMNANLYREVKTKKSQIGSFAYVVILWKDKWNSYHLFRERWVEDANIWYTRVVGYVIHEKNK